MGFLEAEAVPCGVVLPFSHHSASGIEGQD
jgi:hypothetical protein